MKKKIQILILGESSKEIWDIDRVLSDHGFKTTLRFAVNRVELLDLCQEKRSSDFVFMLLRDLSQTSKTQVGRVCRTIGTLPLFILLDSLDGQPAEFINVGAREIVQKNELDRLILSMHRELHRAKAERKCKLTVKGQLELQEKEHQQIISAVSEGMMIFDSGGRMTFANAPARQILRMNSGSNNGGIKATDIFKNAVKDDGSYFKKGENPILQNLKSGEHRENINFSLPNIGAQSEMWISMNIKPLWRENKTTPHAIVATLHDVSTFKKAEKVLLEAESKYRTLVEQIPAVIYLAEFKPGRPILYISPRIRNLARLEPQVFYNSSFSWQSLIHPDDWDSIVNKSEAAIKEGKSFTLEYRIILNNGTRREIWIREMTAIIRDETGTPRYIQGVLLDISNNKKREEKIIEQARLLDMAHDAIVVRNHAERIQYWNKGAERLFGWTSEEVLGQNFDDFVRMDDTVYDVVMSQVEKGGEWQGELALECKDGSEVTAMSRWSKVASEDDPEGGILTISTDITEHKHLETQFLRSQRLESIGTLASGIAHDLNNVLAPIMMSAEYLQKETNNPEYQPFFELITTSTKRASDIVKQVLTFSRGMKGEEVLVQPKHLIKEMIKIAKETFPRNIAISFDIEPNLGVVHGDATQLHQILLNLCVNARDAMPGGGKLTIYAENQWIDDQFVSMNPSAKPGFYVKITVTDGGIGIPKEIQDRIFDPFFSTKPKGQGTGLGLSTVVGIVRSHGGFITLKTEIGQGTSFSIYIPALESTEVGVDDDVAKTPSGQGETVLIVDDEQRIREATGGTLKAYNYNVLSAEDGTDAIALFTENRDKVDLVITDIMMPYMDGFALIRALRRLAPNLPILISSGQTESDIHAKIRSLNVDGELEKPYTTDALLRKLREILDKKM